MSHDSWHSYIKPAAAALPPRGDHSVAAHSHRLQWNENPFDYPADLKQEVLARYSRYAWARYPTELRPRELIAALADHTGLPAENITVGAGSSALIQAALAAVLEPGDHIVIPSPTFVLYRREAQLLGAELHQIAMSGKTHFALPVDELIVSARTNEAKLIALCAPNNPTGTVYARDDLCRIADEAGALLLIDEAYREFCGQDLRPLLDDFPNVILLRTFSKAYAMAGLRVGYALAAPGLTAAMDAVGPPFPLTVLSMLAAMVALENAPRFLSQVDQIVTERMRLAAALNALPGVTVYPSGANFLLVHFEDGPANIRERLREEHDLLISDTAGYPGLQNCLRISIGTPEENEVVQAVIAQRVQATPQA